MIEKSKRRKFFNLPSEVLLTVTLVGSLLLSTGCGIFKKDVIFHPITGSDIVLLKHGETLTAPKQGAFLSDFYIEEVMQAKVKNV